MHTQIWDLRMYKNNVSQYPHIDEIKQTFPRWRFSSDTY